MEMNQINKELEQDTLLTIEIGPDGKAFVLKSELPKWLAKRERCLTRALTVVDEVITEEYIREIYEYKIVKEEPFPFT